LTSTLNKWLAPVFLMSGFAALVYQVVWQRALFAIFGIDTASVTIVVAAFMMGLGFGSHLGGELSKKFPALPLFAAFEIGIGIFGVFSLKIFSAASHIGLDWSRLGVGLLVFLLVLVPTTLMGATLPLLVAHSVKASQNTGRSVGSLYFVNTLGAALACFATVSLLFGHFGMAGSTLFASAINILIGAGIFVMARREGARS
jgi:spermidine synthase